VHRDCLEERCIAGGSECRVVAVEVQPDEHRGLLELLEYDVREVPYVIGNVEALVDSAWYAAGVAAYRVVVCDHVGRQLRGEVVREDRVDRVSEALVGRRRVHVERRQAAEAPCMNYRGPVSDLGGLRGRVGIVDMVHYYD